MNQTRKISLLEISQVLSAGIQSNHWATAIEIKRKMGVCFNSKEVQPGDIFVALKGQHADGHKYIASAIAAGAQLIVYQNAIDASIQSSNAGTVSFIQHNNTRSALSSLSALLCDYPSKKIKVLGVTGTDGKSSTAYLLYQILKLSSGKPTGLISTFGLDLGEGFGANPLHQTTPESLVLQASLAQMLENGCEYAVIESSSHGLSAQTARMQDIEFYAGIFTNLSPEHLEFHRSMEQYCLDKAQIFCQLREGGIAVLNQSETSSAAIFHAAKAELRAKNALIAGYQLLPSQWLPQKPETTGPLRLEASQPEWALSCRAEVEDQSDLSPEGSRFRIQFHWEGSSSGSIKYQPILELGIPSSVYIENSLAALSLSYLLYCRDKREELTNEHTLEEFIEKITEAASPCPRLKIYAPKGRMEMVAKELSSAHGFQVIVDYAHSPGAFAHILPELRMLLANSSRKEQQRRPSVIVLFGSGGERDRVKRPLQGYQAAKYADYIILTDEDPRQEDPWQIFEDIYSGVENFNKESPTAKWQRDENVFLIPSRMQALKKALSLASPGDLVLLLGKGHENNIIMHDREIPWDERAFCEQVMRDMLTEGK